MSEGDSQQWMERILVVALAAVLIVDFQRLFVTNINWDEFYYLGQVYDYLRGGLSHRMQTFHVHVFSWLSGVANNEVDQVTIARLVQWGFRAGTLVLLVVVAKRFWSMLSGLVAVLSYATMEYVTRHATAFRSDPILAFCAAAALLAATSSHALLAGVVSGAALGFACLFNIKALLYVPTLVVVHIVVGWATGRRAATLRVVSSGIAAAVAFFPAQHWHVGRLVQTGTEQTRYVGTAARTQLLSDGWFPNWSYLRDSLWADVHVWVLIGIGSALCVRQLFGRLEPGRALLSLCMLAPVGVFAVYRNSFPYFYVFALLGAVVVIAGAVHAITDRLARGPVAAALVLGLAGLSVGRSAMDYATRLPRGTEPQRSVVEAVHLVFPEPVPYLDRCSMVSSYPMVGPFMSSITLYSYRQAGRLRYAEILRKEQPVFVLANHGALDLHEEMQRRHLDMPWLLLKPDHDLLRANYVHHWGPVWVAGKRLSLSSPVDVAGFEIVIPGRYTLEARAPVFVDGREVAPFETIELATGFHDIAGVERGEVVLRWGDRLTVPPWAPPEGWLFEPL